MSQQQAQQLTADVAGCAENGDVDHPRSVPAAGTATGLPVHMPSPRPHRPAPAAVPSIRGPVGGDSVHDIGSAKSDVDGLRDVKRLAEEVESWLAGVLTPTVAAGGWTVQLRAVRQSPAVPSR